MRRCSQCSLDIPAIGDDTNLKWRSSSSAEKFNGFLDHGTSLTGELTFEGTFRIDGEFHGSITTADVLVIGPRAAVHADIKAGEVKVYGSVFGNIRSTRVEIGSTGQVRGDIRASHLTIEDGAVFEGQSYAASEPQPEPSSAESAPGPIRSDGPNLPDRLSQSERAIEPERSHQPTKKRWPEGFNP